MPTVTIVFRKLIIFSNNSKSLKSPVYSEFVFFKLISIWYRHYKCKSTALKTNISLFCEKYLTLTLKFKPLNYKNRYKNLCSVVNFCWHCNVTWTSAEYFKFFCIFSVYFAFFLKIHPSNKIWFRVNSRFTLNIF